MPAALKKNKKLRIGFTLLLVIVLALPPLVNLFIKDANAGTFTNYKVEINNSQAAASSVTYSYYFTASASTAIKQVDIQVCTTASGTCNAPSGFSSGTPTLQTDNISGTGSRTVSAPTGNAFRVVIQTPATQSPLGVVLRFTGVTNPSTINTTYYARTTTYSDTGTTVIDGPTTAAFAVLDTTSVAVSATVDPNFTFSVAPAIGTVNGDTINVSTTTVNSIPFGTLNTTVASVAAQDLTVTTNATNGYTITASTSANSQSGNPPLVSGTSDNIDNFSGGTNASPATWTAPAGSTPNVNTGFFGYTTNDATLCTGSANRFTNSGPNYAGFSTQGFEVACSSAPVSSETTRIGYRLQINTFQPAGSYTGTVILIATPTY